ncbi:MAG: DUF1501 domain-containing protein [Pirellulaceae bacterium]|jgi:uncharacterized protein (DUF1501 family)|nr:DUF1501 domain-containing protein [Pirellulaceae bacterium]HJN13440.1 DUF1501 domain-containing protein [Pirellulaceae bacterium]
MPPVQIATRRDFLSCGLGLVGVGAAVPNFLIRTALAGPKSQSEEPILVVVQLSGGHDGLSAVVPYRNDDYARNRKQTRISANEVLKINDDVGLHPNLTGFKDLLDQDAFAVVQGVGYPNANRSHFKSMDIWHYADNSGQAVSHGWIGRYCDHAYKNNLDSKLAIAVGGNKSPKAIHGKEHPGIKFQRPESYRYLAESKNSRLGSAYRKLNKMTLAEKSVSSNLDFIAATSVNANDTSDEILKLLGKRDGKTSYPKTGLASSLQTVGSLIAGGLGTRVYYVFQGGFDTHRTQKARHDRLMTEFNGAITAFQKDLAEQGNADRVVTMAFSEFGRRAKENASQGTDHGKAGPMFLFGPAIKAGVHGQLPSLADADLDKGDLKHTVDFRSVYATVLEKWLGTQSQPILGEKFPLVDCLG